MMMIINTHPPKCATVYTKRSTEYLLEVEQWHDYSIISHEVMNMMRLDSDTKAFELEIISISNLR